MEELKNKAIDLLKNNKKAVLAVGGLAVLTALKLHFRGGVCRADRSLEKNVVVITGGNSGIGRQVVEALAKKNCTVIFGARDQAKSEDVLRKIRMFDPDCQVLYIPLDLADKKSIEEFSERVKEVCDCVNILINNAGVYMTERR
jgi:NADP-dependent 3-hydroxy acid dehydrogenase YdfG